MGLLKAGYSAFPNAVQKGLEGALKEVLVGFTELIKVVREGIWKTLIKDNIGLIFKLENLKIYPIPRNLYKLIKNNAWKAPKVVVSGLLKWIYHTGVLSPFKLLKSIAYDPILKPLVIVPVTLIAQKSWEYGKEGGVSPVQKVARGVKGAVYSTLRYGKEKAWDSWSFKKKDSGNKKKN